ncbi:MAG TPA: outer membrane beta-barrel protein [Longimicrobiaceae bacterium]|nr:outer membrane beta-barrel protein [Longimicrobiaceae bacterium]
MRTRTSALLLGVALLAASAAHAQRRHPSDWEDGHGPRGPQRASGAYAGASFNYARPQGEFRNFVDHGFGGDVHFLYQPAARGILGLRFDAGFVNYGHERMRVPLSSSIGGRILVDVNTTNNIAHLGVGPQIGLPDGRLRPYVGGFVGLTYLYTESSVDGRDDDRSFARTTHYDDATFSYGGRAGLYVPLRGGPSPISLDVGVVYLESGEAEYLREGDIIDNPNGSISFTPSRSDTDLLTFRVGVTVGIPRSDRR